MVHKERAYDNTKSVKKALTSIPKKTIKYLFTY
jgi:hypothetical protein